MRPDRRELLRNLLLSTGAAFFPAVLHAGQGRASADPIPLQIGEAGAEVPADFLGLGYEISSVARTGLLSGANRTYVQLVRTLSARGVIRVGGNTSDDAHFAASGAPHSAPVGSVISQKNLEELGAFLRATGWHLLWGLNLATGTREDAVAEAVAVASAAGDSLLGFEIGNEPDLFPGNPTHRSRQYGYADWLREFRGYRAAIRAELPEARFAGPDVADHTDWVERFASDEGRDLLLLTHHYYRECESPAATMGKLLGPDPKLVPELIRLQRASQSANVPYRFCEMNSFCGGGRPGVSDTFGAALWTLDVLCLLARHGCAGVNMETGVNQRGFVSSYSPIADDEHQHFAAAPEFYGMLAFREAGRGTAREVRWDPGGANAAAYAFHSGNGRSQVVLVNKEERRELRIRLPAHPRRLLRLEAPALSAKAGVLLGESAVTADGTWTPRREALRPPRGDVVSVPAASAVIAAI